MTEYKVELSADEKRAIKLPSVPRWELDLLAYDVISNRLRVIECKSYLDSRGVDPRDFDPAKLSARYKLFVKPDLWHVVTIALHRQLHGDGLIRHDTQIGLELAYGTLCASTPYDCFSSSAVGA